MNIKLVFSLVCLAAGGMFSMQRQLQMLQQNSYYPTRYFKWLKGSFSPNFVYSCLFCILSVTLALAGALHFLPFIAAGELVVRTIKQRRLQTASIKKLIYTGRVKRLIVTASCLNLILIVFTQTFSKISGVFSVPVILFAHFPQMPMLIAYAINKPMESAVNRHYIRDAKRILDSCKDLLVIGVTGSYGKTSVKFILNRILSEKFNVTATPESFNTPMGIVRTVREHFKPQTEIFIAEMGAKKPGDIEELCGLCHPSLGIITAVGPQHLETFHTVETVADTKFELAEYCLNRQSGRVYVNFDSAPAAARAGRLTAADRCVSVGTGGNVNCTAHHIRVSRNGTEFELTYKEHRFPLSCHLLGRHSVTNILLAVAVALDLGVSEKQIRFAVSSLKAPPHRLELKPFVNGAILIDDAYNSNPEGCLEAVRVLGSFTGMRRVIVTPGLVELGEREYSCNYELGLAAAEHCDDIILVGRKRAVPMQTAAEENGFDSAHLTVVESFAEAMEYLRKIADRETAVLFENDLPDNYAG